MTRVKGQREHITLPAGHSFRLLRWTRDPGEADMLLGPGRVQRIRGQGRQWHHHPEMELTLFTAGDGTRFVGDHIGPFGAGDLVLLGERVPHHWLTRGPSAGISVQWDFPAGHPFWSFPETLALAPLFRAAARGLVVTGPAAAAVRDGLRELAAASGLERLAVLLRLLGRLAAARPPDLRPLSARAFALPADSSGPSPVGEAVRHLLANFREEIRLPQLLRLTGMSKPTFCRQFKRHAGRTFTDFLAGVRLEAACRELCETGRPVTEIAHRCGFSHISSFNRQFRRRLRATPRQYRARSQKNRARGLAPGAGRG